MVGIVSGCLLASFMRPARCSAGLGLEQLHRNYGQIREDAQMRRGEVLDKAGDGIIAPLYIADAQYGEARLSQRERPGFRSAAGGGAVALLSAGH